MLDHNHSGMSLNRLIEHHSKTSDVWLKLAKRIVPDTVHLVARRERYFEKAEFHASAVHLLQMLRAEFSLQNRQ